MGADGEARQFEGPQKAKSERRKRVRKGCNAGRARLSTRCAPAAAQSMRPHDPAPIHRKPRSRNANPSLPGLGEIRLTPLHLAPPSAAVLRTGSVPAICGSTRPTLSQSLFQTGRNAPARRRQPRTAAGHGALQPIFADRAAPRLARSPRRIRMARAARIAPARGHRPPQAAARRRKRRLPPVFQRGRRAARPDRRQVRRPRRCSNS